LTFIPASRPNVYTGSPLDRASRMRDDTAWLDGAEKALDTLFTPVWRSRSLMRRVGDGAPEAVFLAGPEAAAFLDADRPRALLGLKGDTPVFCVDISDVEDPQPLLADPTFSFTDLRAVAGQLGGEDASVLAHARGLMHWRIRHKFCGVCGSLCAPRSAGNVMHCDSCGAQHFPRTDPAVIMLITDGERALLGHSKRFPNSKMYSTLAGFVEPGESLEEAVRREVFEEAGVRVGKVHYHSSQPWPFPASIMLGFYGEALSEAITIDPDEIADAQWFSRAQMRDSAAHGFQLPRGDSIARRLIEDWIAHGTAAA
jgi:NAD+ diphosphatase